MRKRIMKELTRPVSLSELVHWVKQDLLSKEALENDPIPLFAIDEITVEVNFVVESKAKGGISLLQVLEFGGEVGAQSVQKATIKMTPILDREEMIDELVARRPEIVKEMRSEHARVVFRGKAENDAVRSPR